LWECFSVFDAECLEIGLNDGIEVGAEVGDNLELWAVPGEVDLHFERIVGLFDAFEDKFVRFLELFCEVDQFLDVLRDVRGFHLLGKVGGFLHHLVVDKFGAGSVNVLKIGIKALVCVDKPLQRSRILRGKGKRNWGLVSIQE